MFRPFPYNNIEYMEINGDTGDIIYALDGEYEKTIMYSYDEAMSYKNYKDFYEAVMSSVQKHDILKILCK